MINTFQNLISLRKRKQNYQNVFSIKKTKSELAQFNTNLHN